MITAHQYISVLSEQEPLVGVSRLLAAIADVRTVEAVQAICAVRVCVCVRDRAVTGFASTTGKIACFGQRRSGMTCRAVCKRQC
jgi:hypothetical protein